MDVLNPDDDSVDVTVKSVTNPVVAPRTTLETEIVHKIVNPVRDGFVFVQETLEAVVGVS